MAPRSANTQFEEVSIEHVEPDQAVRVARNPDDLLGKLSHEVFKHDCLDRRLKRHHVTGRYPLDCLKDLSLTLDRHCFFGRGWHWSFSDFRTDPRVGRSCWCSSSIPVRRSYDLRGYAIARRDGQCQTCFRGSHGLPRRVCGRGSWVRSRCHVLVRVLDLACLFWSMLTEKTRLANCMSMVTLTIAAAMFTQYWGPGFGIAYVFSEFIFPF